MSCGKTFLTEEVRAMIGVTGEQIEASIWGIEKEGLRRFTQAIMDPDPRYWDEEFAKTTRYGRDHRPSHLRHLPEQGNPLAPRTR